MSEKKGEDREVRTTEPVPREGGSVSEAYRLGTQLDSVKAFRLGKPGQPSQGDKPPSGGSVLPSSITPAAASAEAPTKPQASQDKPSGE